MLSRFIVETFKFPREVNWLSRVICSLPPLGMGFTGQLLRWDQTAFWSVIVTWTGPWTPLLGVLALRVLMAGNYGRWRNPGRFFAYPTSFFIPGIIFPVCPVLHLFLVIPQRYF